MPSWTASDIYFPTFVEWTRRYVRGGNPLFVPEALRSPEAAVNSLYAFAAHDAIGFSPFAIESTPEPAAKMLAASNDVVAQLTPLIVEHQGRGTMAGLLQEHPDNRAPQQVRLNGYVLDATFERASPPSLADGGIAAGGSATWPAGGLVIATGAGEFLFAGIGVTVTFATVEPGWHAGILNVEEGRFVNIQPRGISVAMTSLTSGSSREYRRWTVSDTAGARPNLLSSCLWIVKPGDFGAGEHPDDVTFAVGTVPFVVRASEEIAGQWHAGVGIFVHDATYDPDRHVEVRSLAPLDLRAVLRRRKLSPSGLLQRVNVKREPLLTDG